MRRLIASLLTAATIAVSGVAATSPAAAVVKVSLSEDERQVLRQAEKYLSDIRTMKARFLQVTSQGGMAEGSVSILRPGRMRLEYDPPAEILIVADGTWLIYVDKELDQVSHLGLNSTPAGILLRDNVSFSDSDVTVTGVRRSQGVAEIDVVMADDPSAGTLTLVFSAEPFELRQWRVKDAQGVETTVSLFDARTGVKLDPGQFRYVVVPGSRNRTER